jgi:hypothetical protein
MLQRLFDVLLTRAVSLLGFSVYVAAQRVEGFLHPGAGEAPNTQETLLLLALVIWTLAFFAYRGNRVCSLVVGLLMAIVGLGNVLHALGALFSLAGGSSEKVLEFALGVATGPWFAIAGAFLLREALVSWRNQA